MYICAPMYPGPVSLHQEALKALALDYLPARYSEDYVHEYKYICASLQTICNTKNDIILQTGEAMLGLWTALKSTLKENDKVLTIGTGLFGDGFADMARSINCEVCQLSYAYDMTINSEHLKEIEEVIQRFKPKMITLVHCETPSGTLNPLEGIGALKKKYDVPLFVVDAVASMGGAPIDADECHIDILLGGSQKCFSCPADLTLMAISSRAWELVDERNYIGYEALKPFIGIGSDVKKYPYTPNTSGVFALAAVLHSMEREGYANVYQRHNEVAQMCREGLMDLGFKLFPQKGAISSPTVTAVYVPEGKDWQKMHAEVKERSVFLGGSLGSLENKIFRIGHMGTQANKILMKRVLDVLAGI